MKKVLAAIMLSSIFTHAVVAQTQPTLIRGIVTDAKRNPVEAATISLMNTADSSVSKMAVTDTTGNYSFNGINPGNYFIQVSAINYSQYSSDAFELTIGSTLKEIDAIVLKESTKNLGGVIVTAKKPLIEQKIDRMIVNVDASITNVGSTALEVLEKSPGVTIDKDGNIGLKGKPNVTIMIDGKPSYLSGAELANLLSNMNSNQLSQIEIMTNPSSKYDAAGNAGVINIKTKKSLTQGFNASVTLNYGQGVYPKINNSIMLNYRSTKFNAFLNYGYMLNK
jgi:hypothetical protein